MKRISPLGVLETLLIIVSIPHLSRDVVFAFLLMYTRYNFDTIHEENEYEEELGICTCGFALCQPGL